METNEVERVEEGVSLNREGLDNEKEDHSIPILGESDESFEKVCDVLERGSDALLEIEQRRALQYGTLVRWWGYANQYDHLDRLPQKLRRKIDLALRLCS